MPSQDDLIVEIMIRDVMVQRRIRRPADRGEEARIKDEPSARNVSREVFISIMERCGGF